MFKSAATRIAHNTTLPALGASADLRPLQDLITLEKTVITSLQRLSQDYTKAAEALRVWGQAEGEDLGNVLGASATLLSQFGTALSQYAARGHVIRENLKSIRSREEALDELKRRRRTVHRKADDAEKKLSKMNPEHKNLDSQTELLYRLKDEIRTLDSEIMSEEAALGDYKRSCTRTCMGLKFGGLLECSEKGTIAADFGNLLIEELPVEFTQPGMPRTMYYGHGKVDSMMNEAMGAIGSVSAAGPRQPPAQRPVVNTLPLPPKGPMQYLDSPSVNSYSPQLVDDFGVTRQAPPTISTPLDSASPGGGRFATFPVKGRQDSLPPTFSQHDPPPPQNDLLPPHTASSFSRLEPAPSLHTKEEPEDSFAASIAQALDAKVGAISDAEGSSSWRGRLSGEANRPPPTVTEPHTLSSPPTNAKQHGGHQDQSPAGHHRGVEQPSEEDNGLLAYMTAVDDVPSSPESFKKQPLPTVVEPARKSPASQDPPHSSGSSNPPFEKYNKPARPPSVKSVNVEIVHSDITESTQLPDSVPPPVTTPDDERKLNAAAFREINLDSDTGFVPPRLSLSLEEDNRNEPQSREPTSPKRQESIPSPIPREPSPLEPPSAPFAQRAVSPPSFEGAPGRAAQNHTPLGSPLSSPRMAPTVAQAYVQSYQGRPQAAPDSPKHYPNPYDTHSPPTSEDNHAPLMNLPPRLQSLQAQSLSDPGMPPRFHALRSQHSSSPLQRELPPRFQGNLTPSSDASFDGKQGSNADLPLSPGVNTPDTSAYRTPGEYPIAASPTTPSSMGPPRPIQTAVSSNGGGKISAAAFKRPQPLHRGTLDGGISPTYTPSPTSYTSPGGPPQAQPQPQSQLPPQQPQQSQSQQHQPYSDSHLHPGHHVPQSQQQQSYFQSAAQHRPVSRELPPPPPGAGGVNRPASSVSDYSQYDYISAYQHSDTGSPMSADFGAKIQQPNNATHANATQNGGGGGYGGYSAPSYAPGQVYGQGPQGGGNGGGYGPPPGQGLQPGQYVQPSYGIPNQARQQHPQPPPNQGYGSYGYGERGLELGGAGSYLPPGAAPSNHQQPHYGGYGGAPRYGDGDSALR